MRTRSKLLATIGVAGALGAASVGVAQAVGESSDDVQVTGPEADKAKAAALEVVGGGRVESVETEGEAGAAWEVEIVRPDGPETEVKLDGSYRATGIERDDDSFPEAPATGPEADKAGAAALGVVGGGRVGSAETEDEAGAAWEVEVLRHDGTAAEVQLDANFRATGVEHDDDGGGSDD